MVLGIRNYGNTCYINTALQLIFNCSGLFEGAEGGTIRSSCPWLLDLHRAWKSGAGVLDIMDLLKTISESKSFQWILEGGQQDSAEFMIHFLDFIHDQIKQDRRSPTEKSQRKTPSTIRLSTTIDLANYSRSQIFTFLKEASKRIWYEYAISQLSPIITKFYGQLCNTVHCEECLTYFYTFEQFSSVDIPVSSDQSKEEYKLEELIADFEKTIFLNGDNRYDCDVCKRKTNASRTTSIWKYPDYLVIVVKRFEYDQKEHTLRKLSTGVQLSPKYEFLEYGKEPIKYRMNSVMNHLGSYHGGHYTATLRTDLDKYIYIDDEIVMDFHAQPGYKKLCYAIVLEKVK